jgi:hypothetical protein
MMAWVSTFAAIFLLDIVYTYYLRCVANNQVMAASLWSVACYLLGSYAVIEYTSNNLLMIPAMLGAFCGTYAGMKLKHFNES